MIKKLQLLLFFVALIGVTYHLISCDDAIPVVVKLPTINIVTDAPIVSKEVYVSGGIIVRDSVNHIDTSYTMQIRGRGNSTWPQPKKPYKIKLTNKQSLFGMPADKEWALLANYFDKSLLRNDVAFELSERIGLPWTPRRRFVDVVLNGVPQGNYLLTETVVTGKDRLNVTLMNPKKPNDTLNSFLVEADQRHDAKQTWSTKYMTPLDMKDPDSVSAIQLKYVKRVFQDLEDSLANLDYMQKSINLDLWIRWVIVNELMRNRDGVLYGSCYFYKDTTGRIAMGPVWDFDLSSGGYESNVPEGWYINMANYIGGMFLYQPYYKKRFKEIWNDYKSQLGTIGTYIDKQAAYLNTSQQENFKTWDILNIPVYDGQIIGGSYQKEVDILKDFLDKRFKWMNSEISKW